MGELFGCGLGEFSDPFGPSVLSFRDIFGQGAWGCSYVAHLLLGVLMRRDRFSGSATC